MNAPRIRSVRKAGVGVRVTVTIDPAFRDRLDGRAVAFLTRLGREFVAAARELLSRPYPPASKPGEPPRRRTGRLVRSLNYRVRRRPLGVSLGADAPYAGFLDEGTRRMKPRPFAMRALRAALRAASRRF